MSTLITLLVALTTAAPQTTEPGLAAAGSPANPEPTPAELELAAREVMAAAGICSFITVDDSGQPQARPMDPFPPEDDLTIWLATNSGTRKVTQLAGNDRATLHCFDPAGPGYVSFMGRAHVVTDDAERQARWKESWGEFYDDDNRGDDYALIRLVPERVDVMSAVHDVAFAPKSWRPATLVLD